MQEPAGNSCPGRQFVRFAKAVRFVQLTDVMYPNRFHADTTAAALSTRALLAGIDAPQLTGPFSYCDIGCGTGFTLVAMGAMHPQAEFVGLDLSMCHVEAGRQLTRAAGVHNVQLLQADVHEADQLADRQFDFVVAHGVLSWVSRPTAHRVLELAATHLKPGGLLFVSYNRTPAAERVQPIRDLFRTTAEAVPGRAAADSVAAAIDRWRQSGCSLFSAQPGLDAFFDYLSTFPPAGLAHEFLVDHWLPWRPRALQWLLRQRDLVPIDSGDGADPGVLPVICRRDVFTRSAAAANRALHAVPSGFADITFVLSGQPSVGPYSVLTEGTRLGLAEPLLRDVRARVEAGGWRARDYRGWFADDAQHRRAVCQSVTQLVAGGVLTPALAQPPPMAGCDDVPVQLKPRLNRLLLQTDFDLDAPLLLSPVTGAGVNITPFEQLLLRALVTDHPEEVLRAAINADDAALGPHIAALRDDAAALEGFGDRSIAGFRQARLPIFRQLGIC